MSIIISGIRLPFDRMPEEAITKALEICGLKWTHDIEAMIYRTSLDARHGKIDRVYSVLLDGIADESRLEAQVPQAKRKSTVVFEPEFGKKKMEHRPIIVGFGPAGLFAAYALAKFGYRPIVLERGGCLEQRDQAVKNFLENGILNPDSNIQFGEGGAGAYSDGKLTTRIHDAWCETVLNTFVEHGAPKEIQKLAKPHIGTDILKNVVQSMRNQILTLGGEIHFQTCFTGIRVKNNVIVAIQAEHMEIPCDHVILALGHSARDTFFMLHQEGVFFEPKPFSVGVRIEHLQRDIDRALYGKFAGHSSLPPGEYTLSNKINDRACYSFCMCPGGHVVAAQSEENSIVTNGMSYHARNGENANAALVVSVHPSDYEDSTPFGGVALQRHLERRAFKKTSGYQAPCQLVGDFLEKRNSKKFHTVLPTYPLGTSFVDLHTILPSFVTEHLHTGLSVFARKMKAFGAYDAVLTGPETRTSSPVRMTRHPDTLSSLSIHGLIPCGEGAGYAGGIMSAAVDGLRAANEIIKTYQPS